MTNSPRIIVIGASAGGIEAIGKLLAAIPADFSASLFIVQHIGAQGSGDLARIFQRRSSIPISQPGDGEEFRSGHAYIAPPDHHLLVKSDSVRVCHGPRENRCRPAIDPLFRSAAVAHGPRVIGVVLTGYLDDGASGLAAVKKCGGRTVVQDPDDAMVPEMPLSALRRMKIDHISSLGEMADLLTRLIADPVGPEMPIPDELVREALLAEGPNAVIAVTESLGHPAPLSCPECGGPLWRVDSDGAAHFRCHTGHAYSPAALVADQTHATEQALWSAYRILQERVRVIEDLIEGERKADRSRSAANLERRLAELRSDGDRIKEVIVRGGDHSRPSTGARADGDFPRESSASVT